VAYTIRSVDDQVLDALSDFGVLPRDGIRNAGSIRNQAVFFMGPAGSGKSFIRAKRYMRYLDFAVIDPDEIKKGHPDYDPDNAAGKPHVHEWSSAKAKEKFHDTVTSGTGVPIIYDGTGANFVSIAGRIQKAYHHGYRTFVIYVWVPAEVSIFRNRNRKRFVAETEVLQQNKDILSSFGRVKTMKGKELDGYKVIKNFTDMDYAAAKKDWNLYPPPQSERPPRPGDIDYGEFRKVAKELLRVARLLHHQTRR
jgi:predicted kinase